jgi:two-component system, OmpR family, sensor histidine kinase QseC
MKLLRQSITTYLLITLSAVILCLFSLNAYLGFSSSAEQIEEVFDAELAQMARVIQSLLSARNTSGTLEYKDETILDMSFDDEEYNEFGHEYERKLAIQAWDQNGELILANHLLESKALSDVKLGYAKLTDGSSEWRTFALIDPVDKLTIRVAHSQSVSGELARQIALLTILPGLAASPLLLLLAAAIIRRGMNPLHSLSKAISHRHYNDLTPINESGIPKELEHVVAELNLLFQRVSKSYDREKSFISDAAHELRTPLAIAKVHMQNLRQITKEQEVKAYTDKALSGIERLRHLVQQLLELSRAEAIADTVPKLEAVKLNSLIENLCDDIQVLTANEQHVCDLKLEGEAHVSMQAHEADILFRNLIDNAFRYSPIGSTISIRLNPTSLTIENEAEDLDEIDIESLFKPFTRGNNKSREGSGLGLSLCRVLCERYGFELKLSAHKQGVHEPSVMQTVLSWKNSA